MFDLFPNLDGRPKLRAEYEKDLREILTRTTIAR